MTRRWLYLWFASGIPVGLALILMPPRMRLCAFAAMICLDTAHCVSPIIAAWSHPGFRKMMDMRRFVWLPVLIVLSSLAIGIATQAGWTSFDLHRPHQTWIVTGLDNPFPVLCWVYWTWNIYHFGMQNFGVARLCRVGSDRASQLIVALGLTSFCMALLPLIDGSLYTALLMTGAVSVNHWVVELGLTQKIASRWWFLPAVLAFGALAFIWAAPTPAGNILVVIAGACARMGLGIVHFFYDRELYRNPAIKAALA